MTAQRWWVRIAARWLARIDGVNGQLRLLFLAMTGYGITLQTLSQYGLGGWALEFMALSGLLLIAYTYYYNEGGVRNQVSRDRQDLSTNYSGPTMLMDDVCIAIGQFVAENGREPTDDERKMIENAVKRQWMDYRNGIPEEWLDDD